MQPLWKTIWSHLKNFKIELPHSPAISLLGTYPKEMKSSSWRSICPPMFSEELITIAKPWKQPKCPLVDEQRRKMGYMYTMEYYWTIQMKEILPFVTICTNSECIMLSEIRQRKANTIWSYRYVKYKTHRHKIHSYRVHTGSCQRQGLEGWSQWVKVDKIK